MSETTLYRKLAEVAAEVTHVAKDGTNTFHNYRYTTAETMLTAIRGPLTARHVVLLPSVASIAEREITTAKGGSSTITTVQVHFTFVDAESGETHECSWAGQGDDPGDKGLGKAYTNAIKTFLREAFMLPMGDDPEADSQTDERAAGRTASAGMRRSPAATDKPTDKQLKYLRTLVTQNNPGEQVLRVMLDAVGANDVAVDGVWTTELNKGQVSALIETFKSGVLPTGESDVPWSEDYAGDPASA